MVKNVAETGEVALNQLWCYNRVGALPATPTHSHHPQHHVSFARRKTRPRIVFSPFQNCLDLAKSPPR